ncbi:MAG TPA: hypothetical protein VNK95_00550 [Caldilineaceae bacterium]|nr:hypothetical protein [Caldilineaceae bacterium]
MTGQNNLITWLAICVILIGIGAIVAISAQSAPEPEPLPTKAITLASPTPLPPTSTPTPIPTVALPTPTFTPIPLALPEVPPPPGGQVILLTPVAPGAVGWARSADEQPNHFGDYNIYAGVYEGQVHVGAFQFDLSSLAPGTPILHADLTLVGLSDEFLGAAGTWTVQLLEPWLDQEWPQRDFHWLSRPDSAAATLVFPVGVGELGRLRQNTFFFPPEALPLLEARIYQRRVSFRILGPDSGENSLFSWDSGYGAGSLARGPLLRIVAGPAPATPPPSPTPKVVIIPPQDEASLLALAAERLTATAQAVPYTGAETPTPTPTPTPLPPNWVTPVIITNTPTPENEATAAWQLAIATAQAIVMGTPTPLPVNIWTATPTPAATATPPFILYSDLTATPTPSATPTAVPDYLRGKILFLSDRTGNPDGELMFMNPDGSEQAVLTAPDNWVYHVSRLGQDRSPDGRFQVVVSDQELDGIPAHKLSNFVLFVAPLQEQGRPLRITAGGANYDAVWSPVEYKIAFVSTGAGNDEIYTVRPDGSELTRLTINDWEWDKHPSWSPDGTKIVFWSNRGSARKQIWVMNADGSGQTNLSNNEFNDWDPVWVK